MNNSKTLRKTLLCSKGGKHDAGHDGIFHFELTVFEGRRFLKGTEKAGQYDRVGMGSSDVTVRWQGDTNNAEYAPRIIFSLENSRSARLGARVTKAAAAIRARYQDVTRESLIEQLGATVVTYIDLFTYEKAA